MRAFVFPGQGSQKPGMGKALAEASSAARDVFAEVDDTLGQKLSALMFDGPEDELMLTQNAQPAIMANGIAVLRVLEKDFGLRFSEAADCVAGHSLGEYTALCAATGIVLPDAAYLLRVRGQAMQDAVPVGVGAMAALLGADIAKASALIEAAAEGQVCEIANDNDPSQVVISGHKEAVERAVSMVKQHDIKRGVMLPVSAPFHCSLMEPAAEVMAEALAQKPVAAFAVPLYANVTAAKVSDPAEEQNLLIDQICGRVRWRESVLAMRADGVSQFVELGGKVLGPMIGRIDKAAEVTSVISMDDMEALAKSLA